MSSVRILHVVETLLAFRTVITSRVEFPDHLCIAVHKQEQWNRFYDGGSFAAFEYFTCVIEGWARRLGKKATIQELQNVLVQMEVNAAKETLKEKWSPDSLIISTKNLTISKGLLPREGHITTTFDSSTLKFGFKKPTPEFVGRDEELQQLTGRLAEQCRRKVVLISAIGGQGKTELCRKFLASISPSPPLITWFGADSAQHLAKDVHDLGEGLKIRTVDKETKKPLPPAQLISAISKHANIGIKINADGWIAVLDNVDSEFPELVRTVQSILEGDGSVLITSRTADILAEESILLELKTLTMSDDAAIQLVFDETTTFRANCEIVP